MPVDSRYRTMSLATLEALKLSTLTQIKQVEAMGQTHSANGRQTTLPDRAELLSNLANIEAAIDFKSKAANAGNNGYASRYSSFSG